MEEKGLREADTCGGVEEGGDLVVGGVLEHDFVEEGGVAVAAGAGVLGVGVVVESVVGGLAEVAAAEDESAEVEVQRVQEAVPVGLAEENWPCWYWFSTRISALGLGLGSVIHGF